MKSFLKIVYLANLEKYTEHKLNLVLVIEYQLKFYVNSSMLFSIYVLSPRLPVVTSLVIVPVWNIPLSFFHFTYFIEIWGEGWAVVLWPFSMGSSSLFTPWMLQPQTFHPRVSLLPTLCPLAGETSLVWGLQLPPICRWHLNLILAQILLVSMKSPVPSGDTLLDILPVEQGLEN